MFKKVLIANRGEIALRIQRACRGLGLETVQIYSEADRDARYVGLADQSLCIGPARSSESYLNKAAIMFAAEVTGAEAIHPGYGFLSENAEFAGMVEDAGLAFIGPPAAAIRLMGDKISAKRAMMEANVPCVPGFEGSLPDDPGASASIAGSIGYPIIIKATAGGGGRGMRIVREEAGLAEAIAVTREEAGRAFGNSSVYMEKFLERPRHIEIQVLADAHGNAVRLGERDCSMQPSKDNRGGSRTENAEPRRVCP
jgi:acetyl-CoA carboxylase biotin carboxylase subunit